MAEDGQNNRTKPLSPRLNYTASNSRDGRSTLGTGNEQTMTSLTAMNHAVMMASMSTGMLQASHPPSSFYGQHHDVLGRDLFQPVSSSYYPVAYPSINNSTYTSSIGGAPQSPYPMFLSSMLGAPTLALQFQSTEAALNPRLQPQSALLPHPSLFQHFPSSTSMMPPSQLSSSPALSMANLTNQSAWSPTRLSLDLTSTSTRVRSGAAISESSSKKKRARVTEDTEEVPSSRSSSVNTRSSLPTSSADITRRMSDATTSEATDLGEASGESSHDISDDMTRGGERRLAITFLSHGGLGRYPQRIGKRSAYVPDGISGRFRMYHEYFIFKIEHGKQPLMCRDGVERICITWTITNEASNESTILTESPQDALRRQVSGKTICNRVFKTALEKRARHYEHEVELEKKKQEVNECRVANLLSMVKAFRPRTFSLGPLAFGLLHSAVQERMLIELAKRTGNAS